MTTPISGSAKIYAFPPRGRFALRSDELGVAVNLQLPRRAELTSGSSGWYHQDAIQESAQNPRQDPRGREN